MTDYQNELVMEHLDLVNWVIRTRISVPNRPLLTYDDFYAIGCEAICRAALKYQADSGEFAPFACRYISFEVTHGTLPFQNCGFDIEGVLPLLKTPNDERRAQAQFSGISNGTSSSIQTSSEPRFS